MQGEGGGGSPVPALTLTNEQMCVFVSVVVPVAPLKSTAAGLLVIQPLQLWTVESGDV